MMDIGELLKDFKSIKLSPKKRKFIDESRCSLEGDGNLPLDVKVKIRRMVKQYSRQFQELHASRARARRTNWRLKAGLTNEEAEDLVNLRLGEVEANKADLGI